MKQKNTTIVLKIHNKVIYANYILCLKIYDK